MNLKIITKLSACLFFIFCLYLPVIQMHSPLIDLNDFKLKEKRHLANFPDLRHDSVFMWPAKFDKYFQDHFGFRSLFIQSANSIRFHLFKVSPRRRVLLGKDGWLFYGQRTMRDFFRGITRYTDPQLTNLKNRFENRHAFLKSHGIEYLIVVVPNKDTIYPEYYSPRFPKISNKNAFDQFLDYLGPSSTLPLIYLKEPLLEAKSTQKEKLYLATDSHWNDLGAFVGYQAIFNELQRIFPQIEPVAQNSYQLNYRQFKGGFSNLLGVISRPTVSDPILRFKERDSSITNARRERARREQEIKELTGKGTRLPLIIRRDLSADGAKNNPNKLIPKAMIYRDSFFARMTKFFSQHFIESQYYSTTYFKFDRDLILEENPDIVIDQFTDHALHPHNS